MPKDKNFSLTNVDPSAMRKGYDERRISKLAPETEEKAEPQSESDIICHYYTEQLGPCPGAMGDERHYVIKNGNMVMAHKSCHQRDQGGEKKTPNVIIR